MSSICYLGCAPVSQLTVQLPSRLCTCVSADSSAAVEVVHLCLSWQFSCRWGCAPVSQLPSRLCTCVAAAVEVMYLCLSWQCSCRWGCAPVSQLTVQLTNIRWKVTSCICCCEYSGWHEIDLLYYICSSDAEQLVHMNITLLRTTGTYE